MKPFKLLVIKLNIEGDNTLEQNFNMIAAWIRLEVFNCL